MAKRPANRPKAIDMTDKEVATQVHLFGSLCATHVEMANWFDVDVRTIENYMRSSDDDNPDFEQSEFFRVYKKAQAESKTSLRRVQMAKAMEGDNTLLIWMGKQLLGQRDKFENNDTVTTRAYISDKPMTDDEWSEAYKND